MKMKKVLAMAVSTLLCGTMLAGCGSSNESSNSGSSSNSETTTEKKTDAAPKNPDEIPYGCKHIVSFIYDIMAALEDTNKGE